MATGRNSIIGIGEQAGKGIAPTSMIKLLQTSSSLENNVGTIPSNALTGNRFAEDNYVASYEPGGDVGAEISTQRFPLLVKHTIGAETTDPEELVGATGLYKHIFVPQLTLEGWLTFLKYLRDAGYYEMYKDCKINQMSFDLTSKAVITYTINILGILAEKAKGSPTMMPAENIGEKLFAWNTKVVNWGVADIFSLVNSFQFTHNNNFDGDDYGLSQNRQDLDVQGGEHTISLSSKFDATQYYDMKDDLEKGEIIPLTINIGEVEGTSEPYMSLVYPKVKLTQVNANIGGADKIKADIQGTALWDNTAGYNVKVEIIDNQATKY